VYGSAASSFFVFARHSFCNATGPSIGIPVSRLLRPPPPLRSSDFRAIIREPSKETPVVTILFASADDHLIASSHTASAATGSGIVVVHSGLECLEAVRCSAPDLLILDDHLPWGGADGVLNVLNDTYGEALAEMPILLLTDDPQSCPPSTLRTYPFARTSCRDKLAELIEMFDSEGVGSA
jgi:hypothetical protein